MARFTQTNGSGGGAPGPQGPTGPQGIQGEPGQQGETGLQGEIGFPGFLYDPRRAFENQYTIGEIVYYAGQYWICENNNDAIVPGSDPAYWSVYSFVGAQGEQGIQGEPGAQGEPGLPGNDGADGDSAYQVALNNGFVGTESEWLDSLVGPQGPQGEPGSGNGIASVLEHEVKAGEALTKGQAVYVSSSDGTNMIVSKASNSSEATSSKTMGLITSSLAHNDFGTVITEGLLAGLDTSTAAAGDPVWLGTNGNLIFGLTNKPVAPAHLVFIGIVTRVQQNNGEIFIKPQNGFELQELHNVLIGSGYASTPTDNDLLAYDTTSGLWKNQTASQAGFATVATSGSYNDLSNTPSPYSLPTASGSILGGIKIGTGLSIDGSGILSSDIYTNSSPTFTNIISTGYMQLQQAQESFNKYSTSISSGATVTLDCSSGNIFLITSAVSGNWTANLTNLAVDSGYATDATLIINQGSTGYIPNAVQIGGVAQTINWQGGSAPTPNANKKDVIALSILNDAGTYTVFGQLVTFG